MKNSAHSYDAAILLRHILQVAAAPAEAPPSSLPHAYRYLHLGAERLEGPVEGLFVGCLKSMALFVTFRG